MLITERTTALQIIQLMLAPAVMISACGLLLLGINNKYSLVVNRIRLLNEEKRRLFLRVGENPLSTEDNVRLESIAIQIQKLIFRVRLVRNSVLSYTAAVALFVVTSFLLGYSFFANINIDILIIIVFLAGMTLVLLGVTFAGWETYKGYEIIDYEVKAHE
ncbi:DUF2721 domain-containing protein [Melioribacteraceae bacterium 4301-Me]|uniref:DUF2721 domain-containing protein n=1 Tax=Pyranulibacter aquaticus TaxID=3163344 RepID=UPI00359BD467